MVKLKKFLLKLSLLIGLFIGFFCVGCSHSATEKRDVKTNEKIKILSTIAQIGDLVSEIGGERIEGIVLVRGELNPHSYELVKGDDEKIQSADLIFYNGLGLEHGISVSSMIQSHPRAIGIGESIRNRFPQQILWKDSAPDPHIWMDISLWKEGIALITDQLVQIDPEGETYYRQRAERLCASMDSTDQDIRALLHTISPEKRYLVTSHDAFHYFARRYLAEPGETDWDQRFAAPEGLSPEGQLRPSDLQAILDHLHAHRIRVLFPESNLSRDSIRKLVDAGKQRGLQLEICKYPLYGDSLRGRYLDAMKHNANVIVQSLNAEDVR